MNLLVRLHKRGVRNRRKPTASQPFPWSSLGQCPSSVLQADNPAGSNVRALTHTGVHFAPSRPWRISARSFWCDPRFGVTAACGREVRRRPNLLLGDTNRDSTESRPSSAVAGTGSVLNKTRVDSQRVHPATTDTRVNTVSSATAGPVARGRRSDEPILRGPDDEICHCSQRDGVLQPGRICNETIRRGSALSLTPDLHC